MVCAYLGTVALLPPPDWTVIGGVSMIVGGFLLANAILFRHPRTLVEEHFGKRPQRLGTIREYIFHRVQVHLGFLFLLLGFGAQLLGHFQPVPDPETAAFPLVWVGLILLIVLALEVAGWWLSQILFRRYVREYFSRHPPNLETDMELARELGELFGLQSSGHDTVQSYLASLRGRIGLPAPDRVPPQAGERRRGGLIQEEPEAEEGLV